MSLPKHTPLPEEITTESQLRRRTLKALLGFGLAGLLPVGIWQWVNRQPHVGGLPAVLRKLLNANASLANIYFSPAHLAPTYPASQAANPPRLNGREGLRSTLDMAGYQIVVNQPGRQPLWVDVNELKQLPKHELVFTFKCVEGWSQIQHWGGVRFADFVGRYGLGTRNGRPPAAGKPNDFYAYVGLATPDGGYYVGLDMPSMLHPQTLLAFEMNGRPLSQEHGAPLRLMTSVKYGVKSLKRIGTITFADQPPRDFWAERGYDYHLGL